MTDVPVAIVPKAALGVLVAGLTRSVATTTGDHRHKEEERSQGCESGELTPRGLPIHAD